MKFNINRPPKSLRKQARINAKRKWHTKFAWLPTSVDETRDTHSRVLFEKYWRQGHYSSRRQPITFGTSPLEFTKFSEKEYFKKKLAGDFDKGESDTMSDTMSKGSVPAAQSVGRLVRREAKPLISVSTDSNKGLQKK